MEGYSGDYHDRVMLLDDNIKVSDVVNGAKIAMKDLFDFTPTLIECTYLRKICEEELYLNNNTSKDSASGNFKPWNGAIKRFFHNLYGYDIHKAKSAYERNKLIELLKRKQEQAHMMIDFSTDLEARATFEYGQENMGS